MGSMGSPGGDSDISIRLPLGRHFISMPDLNNLSQCRTVGSTNDKFLRVPHTLDCPKPKRKIKMRVKLTFCSASFCLLCRSISAKRSTSSIFRLRCFFLCFGICMDDKSSLLLDVMESDRFLEHKKNGRGRWFVNLYSAKLKVEKFVERAIMRGSKR